MALRDLRSNTAAFLDRHAADWRYMHRMWSMWLLLLQAGLNATYAAIGAVQGLMTPVQFVCLNFALGVLIAVLRVLNQANVPGADDA